MKKWGGQLAKTVAGVGAIARAIANVSQEIVAAQRAAADANRTAGAQKLDRNIAAARLGISGQDIENLTTGGARSGQEVDALLGSLVNTSGPGGGRLDRQTVARALNLFRSGAFAADEITSAVGGGTLSTLEGQSGSRLANFGQGALEEIAIRRDELDAATEAQELRAGRGGGTRLAQSRRDLRNARSPVSGAVQGVVGGFLQPVGGDALIEAGDVALMERNNAMLERIAQNTAPRPALAKPPDTP